VVFIVIFLAVVFVFLFVTFLFVIFLVRFLSKKEIGSFRAIREVCIEEFWVYSAHSSMVHRPRWQTADQTS
jgi:hypothetical protein